MGAAACSPLWSAERGRAGTYLVANCVVGSEGSQHRRIRDVRDARDEDSGARAVPTARDRAALVVGNSLRRRGTVKRGSTARVTLDAPAGTHFTQYWWAGEAVRVDCRYAMQIWAEMPGRTDDPDREQAREQGMPEEGQRSGREMPTQGSRRRGRHADRAAGGLRRRRRTEPCSAARENSIRTYQAMVERQGRRRCRRHRFCPDTPLTDGAWVKGDQSLNYDANDNIGVQSAEVSIGGIRRSVERGRPCSSAANPGTLTRCSRPALTAPGTAHRDNVRRLDEGTQPLVRSGQRPGRQLGEAAAVTPRIDRTDPARVDVSVEGRAGMAQPQRFRAWRGRTLRKSDRAPIVGATYRLCPPSGADCVVGDHPSGFTAPRRSAFRARGVDCLALAA